VAAVFVVFFRLSGCPSDQPVKMAGTTYNTLNLGTVEEAPKASSTPRVAAVASVIAAVCVMFFAGRVHQGQTSLYTHEEVMDVADMCGENEFIGQCRSCRTCAAYEFANGGCTYFKDTFCSFCEKIDNCQRENTECTTSVDQKCLKCDCPTPVASWKDKNPACYVGEQCRSCDVCKKGQFQSVACTPTVDTTCEACKTCGEGFYVAEKCSYMSDTVCKPCTECNFLEGDTRSETCTGIESDNRNDIFSVGQNTQCVKCAKTTGDDQRITEGCTATVNSVAEACTVCNDDFWVSRQCADSTEIFLAVTDDRTCEACDELPLGTYTTPQFLTTLCESDKESNYKGQDCTVCDDNEFIVEACDLGGKGVLGVDTNCKMCNVIPGCKSDDVRCASGSDGGQEMSECSGCAENDWKTCCSDGDGKFNLGLQCDWNHYTDGCLTDSTSYKEREAKRNGFLMSLPSKCKEDSECEIEEEVFTDAPETINAKFVLWCKGQCDSFDDCVAFEVDSCLFPEEERRGEMAACDVSDSSLCSLKNQNDVDAALGEGAGDKTCYSRPAQSAAQ